MESPDEFTYLIPEPNVEKFRSKIEQLNRRAKKLGLAPLVAADAGVHEERTVRKVGKKEIVTVRLYRKVILTGERPKLNGWTMLGTVEHDTGGDSELNVLRNAPKQTVPETYRTAPNVCDHCKTKRRRRDTFIIEKDGEVCQIGRNCLQDFIGDINPKGIAWYYELWHDPTAMLPSGDNTSKDYAPIEDYLAAVHAAIRVEGFVSRTAARFSENVCSTAGLAWAVLNPPIRRHNEPESDLPKILDEDWEAAADILTWVRDDLGSRENLTGYLANLVAATAGGWMRIKNDGLVASVFRARENDQRTQAEVERRRQEAADRKAKWAAQRANEKDEFFGTLGEKIERRFTVIKVSEKDGDWGRYYSTMLKDEEGRMACLTGSRDPGVEKGTCCLVKAQVKRQDFWDFGEDRRRVTVLTRGKVIPE